MAVDSATKRASAPSVGLVWARPLPSPDGNAQVRDRTHLVGLYTGFWEPRPAETVDASTALLAALTPTRGAVVMDFHYEVRSKTNQYIRDVSPAILACSIELNNDRAITMTANFTIDTLARDDAGELITIDPLSERIAPFVDIRVDGEWVSLQQGLYTLSWPRKRHTQAGETWTVQASDLAMHLQEDATDSVYTVASGTNIMAAVATILDAHGLNRALPVTTKTLPAAMTWEVGTPWLKVVTDLCAQGNFYTLWFDKQGTAKTAEKSDLATRTPDVTYTTDDFVLDPWDEDAETTRLANKVIVVRTDPSLAALTSTKTNNDPSSALSVANLGRTITKTIKRDGIPDQTTADAIATSELQEAASVYRRGTMQTSVDPRREANEVFELQYAGVTEGELWWSRNWRMDLRVGAPMTHTVARVQALVAS